LTGAQAQTITAPGLNGPGACAGQAETAAINVGTITSVATNTANFRAPRIVDMFGKLRSRAGDGAPALFPTRIKVYNARTGAQAGSTQIIAMFSSSYKQLNTTFNFALSGLTPKTPYYALVYTTASGFGELAPLTRRCFMTGGTYTPTNTDLANGTNGCFSISSPTGPDIRNCLCGRTALFNDATENSAARCALGCANATGC